MEHSFQPELLYALYLFSFPYFSYNWFSKSQKQERIVASYLVIVAVFYGWLYFIGPSVLIFEYPILAVMGIVKIMKLIALNHFLENGRALDIKSSYRNYYLYLISPAEVNFHPKDIDVKGHTKARFIRGSIQLVMLIIFNQIVSYLFSIHYAASNLPFLLRGAISGVQLSLCFQSLTDLLLALLGYIFPDIFLEDVFKYPILSGSPREFWSKRWNLVIQKYICILLYIPLGGKHNKPIALVVIYFTVGIMHEFPMIFLPSAKFGYWLLIFVVHIIAMMVQFLFEQAKIGALMCNRATTRILYRICTLALLALSADLAYSGFGLSVELMAKDFNALFFLK